MHLIETTVLYIKWRDKSSRYLECRQRTHSDVWIRHVAPLFSLVNTFKMKPYEGKIPVLPGVGARGVSQRTEVHAGGPVRQKEAWLRAGQAVGGPGTKTLLPGWGGNHSYIESTKRRHCQKFSGSAFFSTAGVFCSRTWNEMSTTLWCV